MGANDGRDLQGVDPKGQVFAGLAAVLYAAESAVSAGYIDQSRSTAAHAEAATGGLRGKRVLDAGCGYGTTTMALARHAPKEILAIDNSAAHVELLRTILLSLENIDDYLRAKEAPAVLGDLYERTLNHFVAMRAEFREGVFRRNGGKFLVFHQDSTEPMASSIADVIVGNNFLHWPINQRRGKYLKDGVKEDQAFSAAVADALKPLHRVLSADGVAVFLEPKDFVTVDNDPAWDADLESTTMVAHPVFIKMNQMLNGILKEEHGIERKVPKTTALFRMSEVGELFERNGFRLVRTAFHEGILPCNPVDAFFVRFPMWLGSVDLPFEAKLALGKRVRENLPALLTPQDIAVPVRGEYFTFVLERI